MWPAGRLGCRVDHVRTLVLFTRSPAAEARAKGLPRKAGARLFGELLRSWCRAARRARARLVMVAPPGSAPALEGFAATDVTVREQRGDTFAARLEDAVASAFVGAQGPVVLVGGDSPAPRAQALADAFSALERDPRAVVLGPSPDGGVNVIGLARPAAELLAGVPWTSDAVERALRARAEALRLAVLALPAVLDIDRAADLRVARTFGRGTAWSAFAGALDAALACPHLTDRTPLAPIAAARACALAARAPPLPL